MSKTLFHVERVAHSYRLATPARPRGPATAPQRRHEAGPCGWSSFAALVAPGPLPSTTSADRSTRRPAGPDPVSGDGLGVQSRWGVAQLVGPVLAQRRGFCSAQVSHHPGPLLVEPGRPGRGALLPPPWCPCNRDEYEPFFLRWQGRAPASSRSSSARDTVFDVVDGRQGSKRALSCGSWMSSLLNKSWMSSLLNKNSGAVGGAASRCLAR
jgi:hypothetical protein